MSEQQLKRLEGEQSRLERELEQYKGAITKKEAIEEYLKYVKEHQSTDDPFSSDYPHQNPFHQPPRTVGSQSCCTIS